MKIILLFQFKLFSIQLKSQRMNFNSIEMFDLDFGLITSVSLNSTALIRL